MSGSNSSGALATPGAERSTAGGALAADPALMSFTVHSLPSPEVAGRDGRRTARGRLQMLAVLLVCAAPVVASYFAYFVVRPQARTNYGELVLPPRPLPAGLPLRDLAGAAVEAASLRGQWLIVVVGHGACDAACERRLVLQRQLYDTLGAERDRVDKVWLLDDADAPRPETLRAIRADDDVSRSNRSRAGTAGAIGRTTVLRADRDALAAWLQGSPGQPLDAQLYIVDPRGDFMMRASPSPEPARLKRDLDRLLRASASWDQPGRVR